MVGRITRQPSLRIVSRNAALLSRIAAIKADHPFWGYRRVWAYLTYVERRLVNKKRVYRLMKVNHLSVNRNELLKARRTPTRSKPRASRPNEYWGTDMTKIKLTHTGWVYLVIVLDWYSKNGSALTLLT